MQSLLHPTADNPETHRPGDHEPASSGLGKTAALPRPSTTLYGRTADIDAILGTFRTEGCRLLTIVGPGGIGKTRLSIEVAQLLQDDWSHSAVFIRLESLQSSAEIETAIASALGLSLASDRPAAEQIARHLAGRPRLLVLDNFEHLTECAWLVSYLLDTVLEIALLVTSREVLNIGEEWVYPLSGLALTEPNDGAAKGSIAPAVRLFVDRAQRARHGFSLKDEEDAIADICQTLDGSPLAIELAATWTKAMSCHEIDNELRRGLLNLGSTLRDVPPKHRSIAAVFDQSWNLLSDEEAGAFARLAAFRGGFTRLSAESVAGTTLSTLMRLIDKSLVRPLPRGRFDMHELLRQYAEAKLDELGQIEATSDLHAKSFLQFLADRQQDLCTSKYIAAVSDITLELANIRASWHWATRHGFAADYPMAIDALSNFLHAAGDDREGCSLQDEAIAAIESVPMDRRTAQSLVIALKAKGYHCLRLGMIDESEEQFLRAEAIVNRFNLPPFASKATDPRIGLAFNALVRSDLERAEAFATAALEAADSERHRWNRHYASFVLARVALIRGDLETGRTLMVRTHRLTLDADDQWFVAVVLNELGSLAATTGDLDEARHLYEASYAERARANDLRGMAEAVQRMGMLAISRNDPAEATASLRWALEVHQQNHDAGAITSAYLGLARAAILNDDCESAAPHLGKALALARDRHFTSLLLATVGTCAELMIACGQEERAVSLLAFVQSHPASDDESVQQSAYALGHAEKKLSPTRFARASRHLAGQDLLDVVAAVEAELAALSSTAVSLPASKDSITLTAREREVLSALVRGLPNREIAAVLSISEGTVKAHTANIYNKLGVDNRVRAVARAREIGLVGRRM